MKLLPTAFTIFIGTAAFFVGPVNHALAQKGGARGGSAHVSVSHGSPSHGSPPHGSRPGGPGGMRPMPPGHGGFPNRGGGFGGGGFGGGVFIGGGYGGLGGYYGGYGDNGLGGYYASPSYYDSGYAPVYGGATYPPGDIFGTPGYGPPASGGAPLPGGAEIAPQPRPATALVLVIVPTDTAELWFNGAPTQTRGQKREFVTPELPPGQTFIYEVKARWSVNGKQVELTRTVAVQAGTQSLLNFTVDQREQLPPPVIQVPPPGTIKM